MLQVKVNAEIDQQAIQKHIEKQIDDAIAAQMWFVSAKRIAQLIDMSLRDAEDHILSDVRMRAIECRRSRKRLYPAREAFQVVSEIINSW